MPSSLAATALLPSPVPARRAAGDGLLAVARFQARAGLRVDGVPGGRTADLLLAG